MYEAIINYKRNRINGCLIGTKVDACCDFIHSDIEHNDDGESRFIIKFGYNAFVGDSIEYTIFHPVGNIYIKAKMVHDTHLEKFFIRIFEYVGNEDAYIYDLRDGKRTLNIDADNHVEMA